MTGLRRRAVLAAPLLIAASAARAQDAGPAAAIAALDDSLLAVMRAGRGTPFQQRVAMLAPAVTRTFALDAILAASVGPRFAALPAADRATLLGVFTDYTVASYVANFDTYSGERFETQPQTRPAGADQVVSTRIVPASGQPTRLDYVMRRYPDGWRVVDVLVDGSISRVAVQRSDFRSLLAGGSAGPLIDALRARVARLASGAKS